MTQYIDFGAGHTTVVGMSRSGKTYAVKQSAERISGGVLFFNPQLEEVSSRWIEADGRSDTDAMIAALREGEKINFMPSRGTRWRQLQGIVKLLFASAEQSKLDVLLVLDECHLADKDALKDMVEVATTGLRWGIRAAFISQRPALIDNTLMNQSTQFVFFKTTLEKQYLERYGMPYDSIKEGLDRGGQYAYMTYDFHELRGPYKV